LAAAEGGKYRWFVGLSRHRAGRSLKG